MTAYNPDLKGRLHRYKGQIIIRIGLITVVLALAWAGITNAQEKEKIKITTQMREVQGEVSGIGKDYISVAYNKDLETGTEEEIYLPFDKNDLKLEHKRSLKEIDLWDTVLVQYEETIEEGPEGKKEKRKAKVVSFVRAATKRPYDSE
jgi:hypothetical protein